MLMVDSAVDVRVLNRSALVTLGFLSGSGELDSWRGEWVIARQGAVSVGGLIGVCINP